MLSDFKFHHIGVLTNSIQNTSVHYINAGYAASDKIYDPIQDVYICFLFKVFNPSIELIEPGSEFSKVTDILRRNGVSPYHFCYEVNDILSSISDLKKKNYIQVSNLTEAIAINNSLICFLYNKEVGLIELVQSK